MWAKTWSNCDGRRCDEGLLMVELQRPYDQSARTLLCVAWHSMSPMKRNDTDNIHQLASRPLLIFIAWHVTLQPHQSEDFWSGKRILIVLLFQNMTMTKNWQLVLHCHLRPPVPPAIFGFNHKVYQISAKSGSAWLSYSTNFVGSFLGVASLKLGRT